MFSEAPSSSAAEIEFAIADIIAERRSNIAGVALKPGDGSGVARILWFLGTSAQQPRTGKPGKSNVPTSVAETRDLLTVAFETLSGWPDAFDAAVLDRWTLAKSGNTAGQRLGNWYRAILALDGPLGTLLQERLRIAIAANVADPYRQSHPDVEKVEWVSAATAAAQLGVRAERVVDAVAKGRIEGQQVQSGIGHKHTQVRRETVEGLAKDRERTMTKSDAMSVLGCKKKHLELLLSAGMVKIVPGVEQPLFSNGSVDRRALKAMIMRVREAARNTGVDSMETVAFRDINLRRTTDKSAMTSLLRSIAEGKIRARELAPLSTGHSGMTMEA